jgi:peptidyl-prolyl cis-trans isomerase B (cyclophilin B)
MQNFVKRVLLFLVAVGMAGWSQAADPVYVLLKTSKGDIALKLDADKAPVTVQNFVQYVKDGAYNGTIFHRVIKDFMIQGGGFSKELVQNKSRATIKYEGNNGLPNARYTISMARKGGQPDSASNQFFINTADNSQKLSAQFSPDRAGYTVFGVVVAGESVVDAIAAVPTGSKMATVEGGQRAPFQDVPLEPVLIEKAEIIDASKVPARK